MPSMDGDKSMLPIQVRIKDCPKSTFLHFKIDQLVDGVRATAGKHLDIKPSDITIFLSDKCKIPCEENHDKKIEFDDWKSPGPAKLKFQFSNTSAHLKDVKPSPIYLSIESKQGCHVGIQVQTLEGIRLREQALAIQLT